MTTFGMGPKFANMISEEFQALQMEPLITKQSWACPAIF